ncbi:MAG: T9SS type A sorting domain-containing protein, partial [Bacteroidales bacterium]|nr:T9SS type A sorting domain-containing protein [Bacteroidales bacterium]
SALWLYSSDFKSNAQDIAFTAFNQLYINPDNSIIATGKFSTKTSNEVIFGDESFKIKGKEDGLIAKFDSNGGLKWVKALQGPGTHNFTQLGFTSSNDILVTNYMKDQLTYDNETITQNNNNHIIMKISSNNGSMDWYNTFSKGPDFYNIPSFTSDAEGTIYLSGVGNGVWIVPFPGSTVIEEPYRGFIAKIDKDGNLMGGNHIMGGKSYYDRLSFVTNEIYFTACLFEDASIYDENISVANTNQENIVLGKISGPESVRLDENEDLKMAIYPNPATNKIQIQIPFKDNESYVARIFDIHGKMISNQMINQSDNQLNISELEKGMYMIQLTGNNRNLSERLIKR